MFVAIAPRGFAPDRPKREPTSSRVSSSLGIPLTASTSQGTGGRKRAVLTPRSAQMHFDLQVAPTLECSGQLGGALDDGPRRLVEFPRVAYHHVLPPCRQCSHKSCARTRK